MKPKAKQLIEAVEKANLELSKYRSKCKHINTVKIPKSNTGNYDPHDDCYWFDCTCQDCGKKWNEDQ